MTIETAQITAEAKQTIDYSLPEYSEEELAEIEKEDEAYFTPERMAILNERAERLERIPGYRNQQSAS
ncbi:MAG: hypothetical protein LBQ86_07740 [Holophagales bacterium]|jgi:hypothetical protein|nr:hypothetical protein [Holophagales bacterium]